MVIVVLITLMRLWGLSRLLERVSGDERWMVDEMGVTYLLVIYFDIVQWSRFGLLRVHTHSLFT